MAELTDFRTWWGTKASEEQKARLVAIAEDGAATIDSDLVAAMSRDGVLVIGVRWEGTDAGFAFHLTPDMYDVILEAD
jgi:hypothetical protein